MTVLWPFQLLFAMVAESDSAETVDEVNAPVCAERNVIEVKSDSSVSICCSENSKDEIDVGGWLAQMVLTDAKYLRATPAGRVVECAGRMLWPKSLGATTGFRHSREVEQIAKFISHSWQASTWSKVLTLLHKVQLEIRSDC